MSWDELERFVADAEADESLREALKHCTSKAELLLAARTRGYHITRIDLLRAWQQHSGELLKRVSGA